MSQDDLKEQTSQGTTLTQDKQRLCKLFLRGRCSFGFRGENQRGRCGFKHGELCKAFMKHGQCKWQRKCKYTHVKFCSIQQCDGRFKACNSKYHKPLALSGRKPSEAAMYPMSSPQTVAPQISSGRSMGEAKISTRSYASVLEGHQATPSTDQPTKNTNHFLGLDQAWMNSLLGFIENRIQSIILSQNYRPKN